MTDYVAKVDFVSVGRASLDLVGCFRTFEVMPSHRGVLAFITAVSNIDHAMNPCRLSFEIMTTHGYTLGAEGTLKEQFEHAVEVMRAVYFAIVHSLNLQHLIGSDGSETVELSVRQLLDVKDLIHKLEVVGTHYDRMLTSGLVEGNGNVSMEEIASDGFHPETTARGTKQFLVKLVSNRLDHAGRINEKSFNDRIGKNFKLVDAGGGEFFLYCKLAQEHLTYAKRYREWMEKSPDALTAKPKTKPKKRRRTV